MGMYRARYQGADSKGDRAGEDSVTDRLLKRIDTTLAGLGEETAKSE